MKVVKIKKTGEIVYRQQPEFEEGMGIVAAISIGPWTEKELIEEEVTKEEWDLHLEKGKPKDLKAEFAAASTADDKIKVIAESLKLV